MKNRKTVALFLSLALMLSLLAGCGGSKSEAPAAPAPAETSKAAPAPAAEPAASDDEGGALLYYCTGYGDDSKWLESTDDVESQLGETSLELLPDKTGTLVIFGNEIPLIDWDDSAIYVSEEDAYFYDAYGDTLSIYVEDYEFRMLRDGAEAPAAGPSDAPSGSDAPAPSGSDAPAPSVSADGDGVVYDLLLGKGALDYKTMNDIDLHQLENPYFFQEVPGLPIDEVDVYVTEWGSYASLTMNGTEFNGPDLEGSTMYYCALVDAVPDGYVATMIYCAGTSEADAKTVIMSYPSDPDDFPWYWTVDGGCNFGDYEPMDGFCGGYSNGKVTVGGTAYSMSDFTLTP